MSHVNRWHVALPFATIALATGCSSLGKASDVPNHQPTVAAVAVNPCPPDSFLGAGDRKAGSPLWDICIYKRRSEAIDMSSGYFSLSLSAELGDSPINKISDVGVWQRILGKIDQNVQSAVVTMRLGDGTDIDSSPVVPVIALARASDGNTPPSAIIPDGEQIMPYTSLADGTDRWGLEIDYKFGTDNHDKVAGGIVSLGQKILTLYPVGGAVGALLPKVSEDDRKQLDNFVSSLRSYKLAPPPGRVFFQAQQWGEIDHLSVIFYDKPFGEADRREVVTLKVVPDHLASIYTRKVANGLPDYSKYRIGASYGTNIRALAGSTKQVFQKVSPELAAQIQTADTSVFAKVCNEAPSLYASARMEADTDAVFATWLTLMNSPARTMKAPAGMCDGDFEARMDELRLPKFPYQLAPNDTDPAQRTKNLAQTKQNMDQLSAALGTASPSLDEHFADTVVVKQGEPVLPDVKSGEAQVLTAKQVADSLKAANAQSIHAYRFTGVASTVAPAMLQVNGKDVPIQLEWSGVGDSAKVTAVHVNAQ